MDTNYDPFEKHRKLIESLISHELWWGRAQYDTSEILFYLYALREEYIGTLNEDQKHLLGVVNYHAEALSEILDIFVMTSRLLFSSKNIEIQEIDLLSELVEFEKELNKRHPDVQTDKVIPSDLHFIRGDTNLIREAFKNLGRLIGQIYSSNEGTKMVFIRVYKEEDRAKIFITREGKDFIYDHDSPVIPFDVNPEWFIVSATAELHGGEFSIDYSGKDKCVFYLNLPLR